MNKIERHKELLECLRSFSDILDNNSDLDRRREVQGCIRFLEIAQKFGIVFGKPDPYGYSNFRVNEYTRVILWSDGCQISWSDNDEQPNDGELLYIISFPTGAYIFGQHYPTELFREFFKELKSYSPKYLDTANKTLYFSTDNAKVIHEAFPEILKKYQQRVAEDAKRIRKEKLMKELEQLEEDGVDK